MKHKYERLIEALKTYSEEDGLERISDEKLIGQLLKENDYLRNLLNIHCDEETLLQFEREMRQQEQKAMIFFKDQEKFMNYSDKG